MNENFDEIKEMDTPEEVTQDSFMDESESLDDLIENSNETVINEPLINTNTSRIKSNIESVIRKNNKAEQIKNNSLNKNEKNNDEKKIEDSNSKLTEKNNSKLNEKDNLEPIKENNEKGNKSNDKLATPKSQDGKSKDASFISDKTSNNPAKKVEQVKKGVEVAKAVAGGVKDKAKLAADIAKNAKEIAKGAAKAFIEAKIRKIKLIVAAVAAGLLLLIVLFAIILEPLVDTMERIKTGADKVEKLNNFIYGLGMGNSVDAFYNELDYLDKHYDSELNEPMLMATIFYDDVLTKQNVLNSETDALDSLENGDLSFWSLIYSGVDKYCDEAESETDDNGLVYTANKVFRLKKLTKNMASKTGETEIVPFREYGILNASILASDLDALSSSSVAAYSLNLTMLELLFKGMISGAIKSSSIYILQKEWIDENILGSSFFQIDQRINQYLMNKLGNNYEGVINHFANISIAAEDFFSLFTDIKGLELTLNISGISLTFGFIDGEFKLENDTDLESLTNILSGDIEIDFDCNIEYEKYSYDEEKYIDYLKTDYIPNMPEFKDIVYDKNGNLIEKSVDKVIDDIKVLAEAWEEIYGDGNGSAFSNACIGTIKPNIIKQLNLPISLSEYSEINFSTRTAFGVDYMGKKHNGLELNEESVGVTAGSSVFSIYDGTVVASTASNDYNDSDKLGTGGWVKIEHNVTYLDDETSTEMTSNIYSIYGGLDPTNVPVTGTTVTKGQQIGTIGAAIYSEDGLTSGLHFGVYDVSRNSYLNPINMFITCSTSNSGGICTFDERGHVVIVFPNEVLEKSQKNYVVECYSAEYGYGCFDNNKPWNATSSEALVWKTWSKAGARYKNGIAVTKVDNIDRYHVAVTSKMGSPGDLIDAKLENGEVIHMIIGDIKSYEHTNPIDSNQCNVPEINDPGCYGHYDLDKNQLSVLEFQVDPVEYRRDPNPARWNQEWDTSQKVVSITNVGATLNNSSDPGKICPNKPDGDGDIPNGETITGSKIINKRLDLFLEERNSSVELYNNAIIDAIKNNGGYCTRKGAVAAARELINFIGKYDAKLPYTCAGGWGARITGPQANWGNYYSTPQCNTNCGKKCYIQDGLDCAGYVRWVLNTAGYNIPAMGAHKFNQENLPGAVDVPLVDAPVLKPGDIMYSSGHVVFVVGINESTHQYQIAEAAGLDSGVQFSTKSFTASNYTGVNMTGFYNNLSNCIH